MTVDDWPILCQHRKCLGHVTPARWKCTHTNNRVYYYCQDHAQQLFNGGLVMPQQWVQLTPNQRPSQVQEAHHGND